MVNLKTSYLGLEMENPFIAGASSLTSNLDSIKQIEEAGAGALVIASLFEEQVQLQSFLLEEDLHKYDNRHAEMTSFFPEIKHSGPEEHLVWVRRAKEAVQIPVIASLNAVNRVTWLHYARLLADTGVDGLELNFYASPTSFERNGAEIEQEQVDILKEIKGVLTLPVSVKLSPFYANPLHLIKRLDEAGVDGFVLFNRFFQPDIDVQQEKNLIRHNLSMERDHQLPLRYSGLLFGNLRGDICASSGIISARDGAKMILAGATCVQVVSTLYQNGVSHLSTLVKDLESWMQGKGYTSLADFRGKLSGKHNPDPWVYKRAQYVRLLLKPDLIVKNYPAS